MSSYEVINGIRVKQDGINERTGRIVQVGPQFSISFGKGKNGWVKRYWFAVYRCQCGNHLVRRCAYGGDSCGCLAREMFIENAMLRGRECIKKHGMSNTGTHRSWLKMRQRCNDPNNNEYHRYGAKGIKVCDRWNDSFEAFYEDMGDRPPRCSIDRIDHTKGYEPGNCRWATATQQARNTSRNVMLTIDGITRCVSEWAEITGTNPGTIRSRLKKHGYTHREAVYGRKKS